MCIRDSDNTHQPADAWSLLLDWPPESVRPTHLSMLGRKDECGARRTVLIEAEAVCAAREELNLLYVSMTRARQYFFASGIVSARGRAKASFWERIEAALVALGHNDGTYGDLPTLAVVSQSVAVLPGVVERHLPVTGVGRRIEASSPGMTYGNRLHAAGRCIGRASDAWVEPPGGIDRVVADVSSRMGSDSGQILRVIVGVALAPPTFSTVA